jgi:Dimerisation domain
MATSDTSKAAADLPSPAIMLQMITGYWTSQAIFAAAKLGIADLVKDGPKPYEELARATGVRPPSIASYARSPVLGCSAKRRRAALA